MFDMIVATDLNWGIGYKDRLLFRIREDMRFFRSFTDDSIIIVGRKTFDTFSNEYGLEGRDNIIVSTRYGKYTNYDFSPKVTYVHPGKDSEPDRKTRCYHIKDIDDSIELAIQLQGEESPSPNVVVIGGGQIYRAFLERDMIRRVVLTTVNRSAQDVDTRIPNLYDLGFKVNPKDPLWFSTGYEEPTPASRANNAVTFTIQVLTK